MSSYQERENDRIAAWKEAARGKIQDVYGQFGEQLERGPTDPERREYCRFRLLAFCETYYPDRFFYAWSPEHIRAAQLIEAAVLHGEKFAYAMPRGSGKTTLARIAVVWAAVYGHSPYSVLIGKTGKSAKKLLKSIKTSLRFSPLLAADFPDAIAPILHLKGETRKAMGQKFQGESTMVEWSQEIVVLATYPTEWLQAARAKHGEHYGACSSAIIDVCGIEGEIRGRQHERSDGTIIRPTFAAVDDPQDRESARSPGICDEREATIKGDVIYLSGPDRPTGVVIPCTVVYENDLADRLLDKTRNPEFQGERSKFLLAFPGEGLPESTRREVEQHWEEYYRIRVESLQNGNKGREGDVYYRTHQQVMDAGAAVSWPERTEGRVSAIQHAMDCYFRDEVSFRAEYQNDPIRATAQAVELPRAADIQQRVNESPAGVVPDGCSRLFGYIDISQDALWWMILAVGDGFTGGVVRYGVFPDQSKGYVTLSTLRVKLGDAAARAAAASKIGLDAALKWGLETLLNRLDVVYLDSQGTEYRLSQVVVDQNWSPSSAVVQSICRSRRWGRLCLPSRGRGVTSPDDFLASPRGKPKPGEQRGVRCVIRPIDGGGRQLIYDTNYWKTFASQRLLTPLGDPGAISLYRDRPGNHKMIAEQLTAETCERREVKGSAYDHWSNPHRHDEHLGDCLVGCIVAASLAGVSQPGVSLPLARLKPRKKRRGGVRYL